MITKKIEHSLKCKGIVSPDIVQELHLLIREGDVQRRESSCSAWLHKPRVSFVGKNEDNAVSYSIDESILVEMYRHYISEERMPPLTFSQYLGAVENIAGINAA